jgi:hypothetical protein
MATKAEVLVTAQVQSAPEAEIELRTQLVETEPDEYGNACTEDVLVAFNLQLYPNHPELVGFWTEKDR